jgi:RND family efflux transporter MFP subunit
MTKLTRSLLMTLVVVFGLGLAGCNETADPGGSADSTAADTTKAKKKPKKVKKSSVTVAEVITDDLVLPIIAEGSIRARHSAGIRSELSGRIAKILCREGERVRQGQILLQLDSNEYKLTLDEAQAGYLSALGQLAVEDDQVLEIQADQELAPLDLNTPLDEQVAAIREGAYRRQIGAARTGLSSAVASANRALLNLERCEIRAPFSGVISGLKLTSGEWISSGQELFTLVDDVNLEATVNVLESDLGQLESGRPVLLAIPALAETLQVAVDVISPVLNTDSRSCEAILRLRSESGHIKPGMFARAAIAGEVLTERMLIPRDAILIRDGRPLVFKVVDGLSQWIYVQLGERNDHFVEVEKALQGGSLKTGDQVVISNHLTLTHGAAVKVKKSIRPRIHWQLEGEVER